MSQITLSSPVQQTRRGYFQQSRPATTILASFLVLTLPMCILGATCPEFVQRYYIKAIHLWLLGVTHFVITLTIYFQSFESPLLQHELEEPCGLLLNPYRDYGVL